MSPELEEGIKTGWIAAAAAGLFLPLFIFRSLGPLDFWWWMSANIVILLGLCLSLDKIYPRYLSKNLKTNAGKNFFLGILAAMILYLFFFIGGALSRSVLPFAGEGIAGIYAFKQNASTFRIAALMILVIGPGEELFWRAYLQRRWQDRFGLVPGFFLATALYALVHLASGNIMLVLAAAACGFFWGFIYLRYRSVLLNVISHTIWDLLVFILFPLAR